MLLRLRNVRMPIILALHTIPSNHVRRWWDIYDVNQDADLFLGVTIWLILVVFMCDLEWHAAVCELLGVMLVEVGWTRKANHLNELRSGHEVQCQGARKLLALWPRRHLPQAEAADRHSNHDFESRRNCFISCKLASLRPLFECKTSKLYSSFAERVKTIDVYVRGK